MILVIRRDELKKTFDLQRLSSALKQKETSLINQKKYARELMRLFVHRKDVYAVQVKYDEKCIYIPQYRPLTEEDVEKHLQGKITLGVYALGRDNTVKWLCADIDSQHVKTPEDTRDEVNKRCVEKYGLDAVRIEASGTPHNYHVWLFFAEAIEARFARAIGLKLLEGIEHVELFPKQTKLTGNGLGNLVKLPLGYHKKSGSWSIINLEGVKPCTVNTAEVQMLPVAKAFDERQRLEGYRGKIQIASLKS